MQRPKLYILIIALFFVGELGAQEVIEADKTGGCDSVEVHFNLLNARLLNEYASIRWDFGDGAFQTNILNPTHLYSSPGIYEVECELDGGRDVVFIDRIILSETPYADFKFIDTSALNTEYDYYFFPAYFKPVDGLELDYQWTFHDGTIVNDSTVTFSFDAEGSYMVKMEVSDINGCMDSISKRIPIQKELIIPNVFSPNGDEINDYFIVPTTGQYIYRFRIFSSNGLQVFYNESPNIIWDGHSSSGRDVQEGVYFYTIDSKETPAETSKVGFVYLYK